MLNACYAVADAFVCTSEHEGFCIPLLEAAYFSLPVFASGIPAVRETMGGSGVIFGTDAAPELCAQTIAAVLGNEKLKNSIIGKQKARLEDFRQDKVLAGLKEIIEQVSECKTLRT
jgi:glycosyltransferase involved in cell wall biosynthesis